MSGKQNHFGVINTHNSFILNSLHFSQTEGRQFNIIGISINHCTKGSTFFVKRILTSSAQFQFSFCGFINSAKYIQHCSLSTTYWLISMDSMNTWVAWSSKNADELSSFDIQTDTSALVIQTYHFNMKRPEGWYTFNSEQIRFMYIFKND